PAASRRLTSSGERPSTASDLSRLPRPATIRTAERGSPSAPARSATTSSFAFPFSGGAVTATRSAPPCSPSRRARRAPGFTRSLRRDPSRVEAISRATARSVPLPPVPLCYRGKAPGLRDGSHRRGPMRPMRKEPSRVFEALHQAVAVLSRRRMVHGGALALILLCPPARAAPAGGKAPEDRTPPAGGAPSTPAPPGDGDKADA